MEHKISLEDLIEKLTEVRDRFKNGQPKVLTTTGIVFGGYLEKLKLTESDIPQSYKMYYRSIDSTKNIFYKLNYSIPEYIKKRTM